MIIEKIDKELEEIEAEIIRLRTHMVEPKKVIADMEAQIYTKQLEVIKYEDRIREVTDRANKLKETKKTIEMSGWLND